jgi:hypothetical protein
MQKRNKIIIASIISLLVLVGVGLLLYFLVFKKSKKTSPKYPNKYNWVQATSTPSTCSVPCGGGTGYIAIGCVDQNGNPAPIAQCNEYAGPEPPSEVSCNTQPCSWDIGQWSSCSKTCGTGGVQTRSVTCPGAGCPDPQPPTSQSCFNGWCAWNTSAWNPDCSTYVCGKGNQTRTATCSSGNSQDCGPEPVLTNVCDTGKSCNWQNGHTYPYLVPSQQGLKNFTNTAVVLYLSNNQNLSLYLNNNNFVIGAGITTLNCTINQYGGLIFNYQNQPLGISGNKIVVNGQNELMMRYLQISENNSTYMDYTLCYVDEQNQTFVPIDLSVDSSGNVTVITVNNYVSTALIPLPA